MNLIVDKKHQIIKNKYKIKTIAQKMEYVIRSSKGQHFHN